jgi:hypothetical protein
VIYDDPEIVSFMAEDAGVFDPDVTPNGAIRYRDDDAVDGAKVEIEGGAVPCVDAERAARKLVRQQQAFSVLGAALNADLQTVIRFLKGMTHGAIRRGLTITTKPGRRELYVAGGVVSLFEQSEAGDRLINRTILREADEALPFLVIVGDAAVLDANGNPVLARQVPGGKAWLPGRDGAAGLVDADPASYRVDLLGVEAAADGVQWYLFLGVPTKVTDRAEAGDIPTPEIPGWARDGGLLPIARVTTCHKQKGIAAVEIVAPRFNGV